jgi:hypothetical protein
MKSTFLFLAILVSLMTGQVFAQTKKPRAKIKAKPTQTLKKKAVTKKVTTTVAPTKVVEAPKTSFDKFYERLGISFGSFWTSPTLEKWDSNNAALSPEFSGGDPCRNCDTYSFNAFNQFNFSYNFGAKMKFNVIPRFTVFFDSPKDQSPSERGNVILEDALIAFSGVIYSSTDKKFNWWIRPGVRMPTSHASKTYNNDDFGRLTYGIEILQSFTYDFNPKWQLGLTVQDRYWIFENRYNASRNRYYIAPNFTYTINDTTKFSAYYENMLENNKRWKSINGKDPVYYSVWQNAYVGISKDVTPKLNIYPYVSAFVNDVPFSMRSFWLGAWISYTIK